MVVIFWLSLQALVETGLPTVIGQTPDDAFLLKVVYIN